MLVITTMLLYGFAASDAGDVAKLEWMSGCFAVENPRVKIEEQWMKPEGGLMLGVNRTLRGGKAVEHELLRISVKGGEVVYDALIGTPGQTPFKATSLSESEVIFENPAHDFPKRIIYRKTADGVTASIDDGKPGGKHVDYPFKSVRCAGK